MLSISETKIFFEESNFGKVEEKVLPGSLDPKVSLNFFVPLRDVSFPFIIRHCNFSADCGNCSPKETKF